MSQAIELYQSFLTKHGATFALSPLLSRDQDADSSLLPQGPRPRRHKGLIEGQDLLEYDHQETALGSDHATFSLSQEIVQAGETLASKRFLDLGCGTGLLGMVAASFGAQVVATDIDKDAIALSQKNCRSNGLTMDLRLGSLCEPLKNEAPFDFIVVNLPHKPAPDNFKDLPLGQAGGPEGDSLWNQAIPDIASLQNEGAQLNFFLHSLPHPRLISKLSLYYDLTLMTWKIRWFQAEEFKTLLSHFEERHRGATSFLWQEGGKTGIIACVWRGLRKVDN